MVKDNKQENMTIIGFPYYSEWGTNRKVVQLVMLNTPKGNIQMPKVEAEKIIAEQNN